MASLLNDLDKLDAADINSNEPNPTNIVVEDKDTAGGTLVDISTVDEVSTDKSTLTIQRIVGGVVVDLRIYISIIAYV